VDLLIPTPFYHEKKGCLKNNGINSGYSTNVSHFLQCENIIRKLENVTKKAGFYCILYVIAPLSLASVHIEQMLYVQITTFAVRTVSRSLKNADKLLMR
jgi:hypothetical protein